jgi:hypothetical protein
MSLLPAVMPERAVALMIAVGWCLVWFLGHGLLIGLVVAALLRSLRRRSADLRYGIACAGLLVMVLCPVGTTLRFLAAAPSRWGTVLVGRPAGRRFGLRSRHAARRRRCRGEHELSGTPAPAVGQSSTVGVLMPFRPVPSRDDAESRWPERIEPYCPRSSPLADRGRRDGTAVDQGTLRRPRSGPSRPRLPDRGTSGPDRSPDGALRPSPPRILVPVLRVEVPTVVGWLRPTVLIRHAAWRVDHPTARGVARARDRPYPPA